MSISHLFSIPFEPFIHAFHSSHITSRDLFSSEYCKELIATRTATNEIEITRIFKVCIWLWWQECPHHNPKSFFFLFGEVCFGICESLIDFWKLNSISSSYFGPDHMKVWSSTVTFENGSTVSVNPMLKNKKDADKVYFLARNTWQH